MPLTHTYLNHRFLLRDLGCSNSQYTYQLPRHRWYSVKEAFSPVLVQHAAAASACQKGDSIIDPFGGSGTVSLVASELGLRCTAIEVNPFLAFVSKVKLAQCPGKGFERVANDVIANCSARRSSTLEAFSTFGEGSGKKKWLFNTSILRAVESAWQATKSVSEPKQDLTRLAIIAAAMENCNAFRDGKCLRYRRDWRKLRLGKANFIESFTRKKFAIRDDLDKGPNVSCMPSILSGDCREILPTIEPETFDLCVTSPPYLNSFDYTDIYRPELFLGNFVISAEELKQLRQLTVRSHVQANWNRPNGDSYGKLYSRVMKKLQSNGTKLWDYRIPLMVQAYFEDMHHILSELWRISRSGAQLWLVVATSAYGGVEIPVDRIIGDIGQSVGWSLHEIGVLRNDLRSSGQHWNRANGVAGNASPRLRESVVVFKVA